MISKNQECSDHPDSESDPPKEEPLSNLDSTCLSDIEKLCVKEVEARLAAFERGEMTSLSDAAAITWLNNLKPQS